MTIPKDPMYYIDPNDLLKSGPIPAHTYTKTKSRKTPLNPCRASKNGYHYLRRVGEDHFVCESCDFHVSTSYLLAEYLNLTAIADGDPRIPHSSQPPAIDVAIYHEITTIHAAIKNLTAAINKKDDQTEDLNELVNVLKTLVNGK